MPVLVCAGPALTQTSTAFSFVCCRVRSYMFADASAFNADLSKWVVSSVTDMRYVCARRGEQRGAE